MCVGVCSCIMGALVGGANFHLLEIILYFTAVQLGMVSRPLAKCRV